MKDLICFHAFENIYGIPLEMVRESFEEQKVTVLPYLNHLFTGLCNHNGIIYTVLSFSRLCNRNIPDNRCCMLLLELNKHQLILRMNDVPFIIHTSQITQEANYKGGTDIFKIHHICQVQDQTIYVLDMEQIVEILSEHMLEKSDDTLQYTI